MKVNNYDLITDAQRSLHEEQGLRAKRYFISMLVRTLCFIFAVISSGFFMWFFIALAMVLPYVAVVVANAGRESARGERFYPLNPTKELE